MLSGSMANKSTTEADLQGGGGSHSRSMSKPRTIGSTSRLFERFYCVRLVVCLISIGVAKF